MILATGSWIDAGHLSKRCSGRQRTKDSIDEAIYERGRATVQHRCEVGEEDSFPGTHHRSSQSENGEETEAAFELLDFADFCHCDFILGGVARVEGLLLNLHRPVVIFVSTHVCRVDRSLKIGDKIVGNKSEDAMITRSIRCTR